MRTCVKTITGNGMVGMGMFLINGQVFTIDVVNDTVPLNATEIWTFVNNSNMAHPMHIHGVSFFVMNRNGLPVAPEEAGAKDVVLVDRFDTVRTIMRFEHLSHGYPFMYYCHNLMHEDNMMMLQFIVADPDMGITGATSAPQVRLFPNPTSSTVAYAAPFPVQTATITNLAGRVLRRVPGTWDKDGGITLGSLPAGLYTVTLEGSDSSARVRLIRE